MPFVTSQRDACQNCVFYHRWRYQKEEDGLSLLLTGVKHVTVIADGMNGFL